MRPKEGHIQTGSLGGGGCHLLKVASQLRKGRSSTQAVTLNRHKWHSHLFLAHKWRRRASETSSNAEWHDVTTGKVEWGDVFHVERSRTSAFSISVQSIRKNKRKGLTSPESDDTRLDRGIKIPLAPPNHCVRGQLKKRGGGNPSSRLIRDSRQPDVNRGVENGVEQRLLKGDKPVFCLGKWCLTVERKPGLTLQTLFLDAELHPADGSAGISE